MSSKTTAPIDVVFVDMKGQLAPARTPLVDVDFVDMKGKLAPAR